jgi:hypothetical protein
MKELGFHDYPCILGCVSFLLTMESLIENLRNGMFDSKDFQRKGLNLPNKIKNFFLIVQSYRISRIG